MDRAELISMPRSFWVRHASPRMMCSKAGISTIDLGSFKADHYMQKIQSDRSETEIDVNDIALRAYTAISIVRSFCLDEGQLPIVKDVCEVVLLSARKANLFSGQVLKERCSAYRKPLMFANSSGRRDNVVVSPKSNLRSFVFSRFPSLECLFYRVLSQQCERWICF